VTAKYWYHSGLLRSAYKYFTASAFILNSSYVHTVSVLIACEIVFSKRGFRVRSFGTGTHVKLPGSAPDRPNVYDFSTTYDEIYNDLWKKDRQTYTFVWFCSS